MRLVQLIDKQHKRRVGLVSEDEDSLHLIDRFDSTRMLALEADRTGSDLASLVRANVGQKTIPYDEVIAAKRLLPPLDHPDPAHCLLSGTGLTHLGSAKARDEMHTAANSPTTEAVTDSMRMFRWGLEGGKPPAGEISVQPEWFYKGDGRWVVAPEQPLIRPPFALDGGEEPELAGLYVIGDAGNVLRLGFALGNEFSDHIMEKKNYLYLAHSKLRSCSFGPELVVGELPPSVRGTVRIWRDGHVLWEKPFLSGEANMSYSFAALEHHHFKYEGFRKPGDVHCHFFGTATLSFADGIETQQDDLFEIEAEGFGRPLRNPLTFTGGSEQIIPIKTL
jgi:hypothetical protein